jgi:hypothetical protein
MPVRGEGKNGIYKSLEEILSKLRLQHLNNQERRILEDTCLDF